MPKTYTPKPKSKCDNCEGPMTRRRRSASGEYYCSKEDCQKKRRARAHERKKADLDRGKSLEQDALDGACAEFIRAALHDPRVACPLCGLTNGIEGYGHFGPDGAGCAGLGGAVAGVRLVHALAVWPPEAREFADLVGAR